MQIPVEELSPEALDGLVEEFVTREGTDYGVRVFTFEEKKGEVMRQIQRGEVVIVFDPESETCNLVLRQELGPVNAPRESNPNE